MPCLHFLSVFEKPWKFGGLDAIRTVLDYTDSNVKVVVVTDATQYRTSSLSCKTPMDIWWLNEHGGWDRFVFNTKKTYSTSVEGGIGWQDGNGIERYSSRGNIRKRVDVVSQPLDPATRRAVATLRYSVQAYERTADGAFLPIKIEEGDFADYRDSDNILTVAFSFTYGALIQVQKQ